MMPERRDELLALLIAKAMEIVTAPVAGPQAKENPAKDAGPQGLCKMPDDGEQQ
jgi:hypothetical protein